MRYRISNNWRRQNVNEAIKRNWGIPLGAGICLAAAVISGFRLREGQSALAAELEEALMDGTAVPGVIGSLIPGQAEAGGWDSGRKELLALRRAYPDRISDVVELDGEWAALIEGEWFFWEGGRLLPEDLRGNRESYGGIRFYSYIPGEYRTPIPDPETAAILRERGRKLLEERPMRYPGFYDALYGISSEEEGDRVMERITFLGLPTRVHPMIVEPLRLVEEELLRERRDNHAVDEFLKSIEEVGGFSWRSIAGTESRSYHSYGVAVDLVPASYDGVYPYWRWAMAAGVDEWWNLPEDVRWEIPQEVIDVFERNRFIWGGKWLFFDSMHFEYRPEIFLLADR